MYIPWSNYSNNIFYEVYTIITIYYCIVCGQCGESLLLLATCFLVTASLKILGVARKDLGGAKPLFGPLKYAYVIFRHYNKTVIHDLINHNYIAYMTFNVIECIIPRDHAIRVELLLN